MNKLPIEILSYLFEFLSFYDRAALKLTCKRFYQATLTRKFIELETYVISKTTVGLYPSVAINTLIESCRTFTKLEFHDVDFQMYTSVWDRHGTNIQKLCFHSCAISSKRFVEILNKCRNLKTLHIFYSRDLFMSGNILSPDHTSVDFLNEKLIHLEDLQLVHCTYLSDAIFNRFMELSPNLSAVSLNNCQISFHTALHRRFYPEYYRSQGVMVPSKNVLTFIYILDYIKTRSRLIKSLNFGSTYIDSRSTETLFNIPGLHLKHLSLNDCMQLSSDGFFTMAISLSAKTLKYLNISHCAGVSDAVVIAVCFNIPCLETLDISHCEGITNDGIQHLKHLKYLSELNISCCSNVTGEGLLDGLLANVNSTLTKLFARGIDMKDDTLKMITSNSPELTHLNLSYCKAVNNNTTSYIFKNLCKLVVLKLSVSDGVTDYGLTGLNCTRCQQEPPDSTLITNFQDWNSNSIKRQAELMDVHKNPPIKKKLLVSFNENETVYSIKCLRGLKYLDLRECYKISDTSFQYAFKFPDITVLKLSLCWQITNTGINYIVKFSPGIVELDLSYCYNVTDEGVAELTVGLQRLQILSLRGNRHLTNLSLFAILSNCKTLFVLDVVGCCSMSHKLINSLLEMETMKTVFGSRDHNNLVYPPPNPPPNPFGNSICR